MFITSIISRSWCNSKYTAVSVGYHCLDLLTGLLPVLYPSISCRKSTPAPPPLIHITNSTNNTSQKRNFITSKLSLFPSLDEPPLGDGDDRYHIDHFSHKHLINDEDIGDTISHANNGKSHLQDKRQGSFFPVNRVSIIETNCTPPNNININNDENDGDETVHSSPHQEVINSPNGSLLSVGGYTELIGGIPDHKVKETTVLGVPLCNIGQSIDGTGPIQGSLSKTSISSSFTPQDDGLPSIYSSSLRIYKNRANIDGDKSNVPLQRLRDEREDITRHIIQLSGRDRKTNTQCEYSPTVQYSNDIKGVSWLIRSMAELHNHQQLQSSDHASGYIISEDATGTVAHKVGESSSCVKDNMHRSSSYQQKQQYPQAKGIIGETSTPTNRYIKEDGQGVTTTDPFSLLTKIINIIERDLEQRHGQKQQQPPLKGIPTVVRGRRPNNAKAPLTSATITMVGKDVNNKNSQEREQQPREYDAGYCSLDGLRGSDILLSSKQWKYCYDLIPFLIDKVTRSATCEHHTPGIGANTSRVKSATTDLYPLNCTAGTTPTHSSTLINLLRDLEDEYHQKADFDVGRPRRWPQKELTNKESKSTHKVSGMIMDANGVVPATDISHKSLNTASYVAAHWILRLHMRVLKGLVVCNSLLRHVGTSNSAAQLRLCNECIEFAGIHFSHLASEWESPTEGRNWMRVNRAQQDSAYPTSCSSCVAPFTASHGEIPDSNKYNKKSTFAKSVIYVKKGVKDTEEKTPSLSASSALPFEATVEELQTTKDKLQRPLQFVNFGFISELDRVLFSIRFPEVSNFLRYQRISVNPIGSRKEHSSHHTTAKQKSRNVKIPHEDMDQTSTVSAKRSKEDLNITPPGKALKRGQFRLGLLSSTGKTEEVHERNTSNEKRYPQPPPLYHPPPPPPPIEIPFPPDAPQAAATPSARKNDTSQSMAKDLLSNDPVEGTTNVKLPYSSELINTAPCNQTKDNNTILTTVVSKRIEIDHPIARRLTPKSLKQKDDISDSITNGKKTKKNVKEMSCPPQQPQLKCRNNHSETLHSIFAFGEWKLLSGKKCKQSKASIQKNNDKNSSISRANRRLTQYCEHYKSLHSYTDEDDHRHLCSDDIIDNVEFNNGGDPLSSRGEIEGWINKMGFRIQGRLLIYFPNSGVRSDKVPTKSSKSLSNSASFGSFHFKAIASVGDVKREHEEQNAIWAYLRKCWKEEKKKKINKIQIKENNDNIINKKDTIDVDDYEEALKEGKTVQRTITSSNQITGDTSNNHHKNKSLELYPYWLDLAAVQRYSLSLMDGAVYTSAMDESLMAAIIGTGDVTMVKAGASLAVVDSLFFNRVDSITCEEDSKAED